ncbi:MAG: hypothetical protein HY985_16630 [Magnetospirillum sp.]|nr:hypothetical protein [Magnetospirillum sp.]
MTIDKADCNGVIDLLARWQTFSVLQQRAFAFLAFEAIATGQEFESSTEGATGVLSRIGQFATDHEAAELQAETFAVVHKLQAADRSRQGLEQVASVLTTLKQLHADLVDATRATAALPDVQTLTDAWVASLSANVNLADWRRRLEDALHGREATEGVDCRGEEELF